MLKELNDFEKNVPHSEGNFLASVVGFQGSTRSIESNHRGGLGNSLFLWDSMFTNKLNFSHQSLHNHSMQYIIMAIISH